jgi:hypothetical protein
MSETERVMLDIETLGTEPGCAIVSIGCVRFGPDGITDEWYYSIDLESCQRQGLTIDAETMLWWLDQDDDVREQLDGETPINVALCYLAQEIDTDTEVWACPPAFDCVLLGAAYDHVNQPVPWQHYQRRCYRTIREEVGLPELDREGDHHNALDDARYQARRLVASDEVIVDD